MEPEKRPKLINVKSLDKILEKAVAAARGPPICAGGSLRWPLGEACSFGLFRPRPLGQVLWLRFKRWSRNLPRNDSTPGYLKAVWPEVFGPLFRIFSVDTDPWGSPQIARARPAQICTGNQTRRPILKPFRGIPPSCLQVPATVPSTQTRSSLWRTPLAATTSFDEICSRLLNSRGIGIRRSPTGLLLPGDP